MILIILRFLRIAFEALKHDQRLHRLKDQAGRKQQREISMARRLAAGRFSPGTKKAKENNEIEDPPDVVRNAGLETISRNYSDDNIFMNEEDVDEDDEHVDLSVVRSVLGASFKLDKETTPANSRNVSFSGVDTPESQTPDEAKTRGDLLAKIERLKIALKQAQIDVSAEKARRKKSSRSTIKLAKEINKRTVEAAATQRAVAKLTEINATLETKLNATRKELDERIASSELAARDYHKNISESQQKYRDACDEYDRRMSEMTKAHNHEIDGLRRQLAVANKDLDMLRGKLVSLEVKEAERIAEHTVYTGIDPTAAKQFTKKKRKKAAAIGVVLLAFAWFYQLTAFSMDAICGPVMPGTKFTLNKDRIYEAPWWAPAVTKPRAFALCGGRQRTSLSWNAVSGELGRLIVETLDVKYPYTLLDRKAQTVIIKYDRLDIIEKKGKVESVKLPWI